MSYLIEYNRKVYRYKGDYDDEYILLVREGDNNVFDMNNRRVKDWNLIARGWESQLWHTIAERAGDTMGGNLQVPDGWNTKFIDICEYIERHRKAIKNAKPIEKLFDDFKEVVFVLRIFGDPEAKEGNSEEIAKTADEYVAREVEKFTDKYGAKLNRTIDFGRPVVELRENIDSVEKLMDALDIWSVASKHRKMVSHFVLS